MSGFDGRTTVRRRGRIWAVVAAALIVVGTIGQPIAEAAPVQYSPTPIAGWSTNAPVKAVLIVGDTVYVGGDFTQVRPPGGGAAIARTRLAGFDVHTGA